MARQLSERVEDCKIGYAANRPHRRPDFGRDEL
jgi:hypothetical protein